MHDDLGNVLPRGEPLRLDPAQKRALLATLLRRDAPATGPTPLSYAQRGLWLLAQLEPGSATYNVAFAVRLRGTLDTAALERALSAIVRRHDALHSVLALVDGEPVARAVEGFRLALPLVDTILLEAAPSVTTLLAEHAERAFDLEASPAIRALLVRTAADDHALSVAMHHSVTDGWSMGIFKRELGLLYDAYRSGRPSPLDALPTRYADFALWQREQLSGDFLESRLRYWTAALRDAPARFDLIPQRGAAPLTSRGRAESRHIAGATRDALHALAREHRSTLFCTLFAAFVAVLHRYTGLRDIVVGTALANRTRADFEGLVGCFVNTLPLRTRIAGDPPFDALLAQVTAATLEAFEYQALPFERLVAELHPARSAARPPLVNVMFVLQNAPDEPLALSGLEVTPLPPETTTAKFDLTLQITDAPGGLAASLEYSTDLYEAATIAALRAAFEHVLRAIVREPACPLSQLPLLSAAAARRQLQASHGITRALQNCRIEALFERHAGLTPHAVAVVDHAERLSYAALNARANRLAHRLHAEGVRPGERAGLCLERGTNSIVAMLAVLKAGAAYVPLDPDYPPERLAFVVRDTRAALVVTERRFLGRLRGLPVRCLTLDADAAQLERCPDTNPAVPGSGADLAYVMYTSGSGGTPKGVMIPHRAVERVAREPDYARITPADAVAHGSNVSFDASTFEVWAPLLGGARLVVVPKDVLLAPEALARHIALHRVSVMFLTTALFEELARTAPAAFKDLNYLLIGGEALDARAVERIAPGERPPHVLNVYGPTEATTFSTFYEFCGAAPNAGTSVPIGRPIAETQVLILDERRNLLPPGAVGELYVGGAGLALGYLDDAESTARKFVAHPFSQAPGAKLYATGDFARYLPGGDIEFIGRADGQLKVRGFRIEPGEVEAALRACPGVNEAAAIARDDAGGNKRLVGFVAVAEPESFDVVALRRTLRRRLPPHLVPDTLTALAALPLTSNGKLDRSALTAPRTRAATWARPGSELQAQLILLWERLLDVRPIGIRDDFFALGGNSLSAVRLIGEIERNFQTRLPLAVLFEEPTIEHLADLLREGPQNLNRAPLTTLHADGAEPGLFFLHGSLTGGGYYCLALAQRLGADRPLHLLRPHGVDGAQLPPSIEAMAEDYVRLLTTVQPRGPYLLGGFCSGGLVAFAMAQALRARGDGVSKLVLLDVPSTNRVLRGLAETIDRYGTAFRIDRRARALLIRSLARFPQHLRRWAESSSKSAFVRERLPRVAHFAARAIRNAETFEESSDLAAPRNLLKEWKQISEAYVPRTYDGRLTVLVSENPAAATRPPARGWSSIAPQVDVRVLRGDHFTCITEHIDSTAATLAAALLAD